MAIDAFGIQILKSTKQGGQNWTIINDDFNSDSQVYTFSNTQEFGLSSEDDDRGTRWTISTVAQFYTLISTSRGFDDTACTRDQQLMTTRGYMQTTQDWKNVEFTSNFRVFTEADDYIRIGFRGGKHQGSGAPLGCTGSNYAVEIHMQSGGLIRIRKESWHSAFHDMASAQASGFDSTIGHCGFTLKVLCYNSADNNSVNIEVWIDHDNDNNFVKALSAIDTGSFNSDADQCGCSTKGQPLIWGSPTIMIQGNAGQFGWKNTSIREIDPYGTGSSGGTPGSTDDTPIFDPPESHNFVYSNGDLWSQAKIYFIFWGADWNTRTTPFSKQDIQSALTKLFDAPANSSYFDSLIQYNVKRPTIGGFVINTTYAVPSSSTAAITQTDVEGVVKDSITKNLVPTNTLNGRNLYYVITPSGHPVVDSSGGSGTPSPTPTPTPTPTPPPQPATATPILSTPATSEFYDQGGMSTNPLQTYFIWWGSDWSSGSLNKLMNNTITAMGKVFSSHYFDGCFQYGFAKRPVFKKSVINSTYKLVNNYNYTHIKACIDDSVKKGLVPAPTTGQNSNITYIVISSPSIKYNDPNVGGEHRYQYVDPNKNNYLQDPHYLQVTIIGAVEKTQDDLTEAITHEMVEEITDPAAGWIVAADSSFRPTVTNQYGIETCDVCETSSSNRRKFVSGVAVAGYWSDEDGACIAPSSTPSWIHCPTGYTWDDPSQTCKLTNASAQNTTLPATATPTFETPTTNYVEYQGAPVITPLEWYFLFPGGSSTWGSGSNATLKTNIMNAMSKVFNSPYFDTLIQYGGNRRPVLKGTVIVNSSLPASYGDTDVMQICINAINAGQVPTLTTSKKNIAFYVVSPPNTIYNAAGAQNGGHNTKGSVFTDPDIILIYGWVVTKAKSDNHLLTLAEITKVITHEMVEATTNEIDATDHWGYVIKSGTPIQSQVDTYGNEMADVCQGATGANTINGVTVEAYWSDQNGGCVVPTNTPDWVSCPTGYIWDETSQTCKLDTSTDPSPTPTPSGNPIELHSYYPKPANNSQPKFVYAWSNYAANKDSQTVSISRQLVNALTDPVPYTGIADSSTKQNEIADVCSSETATVTAGVVKVSKYWSNQDNGCIAPNDAPTFVNCQPGLIWDNTSQTCVIDNTGGTGSGSGGSGGGGSTSGQPIGYPVVAWSASSDDGNVPSNAGDNNLNTRWSGNGIGQFLKADLGANKNIDTVKIAWYHGETRINHFEIWTATSTDTTYTKRYGADSAKGSNDLQTYTFAGGAVSARYIKIVVNGNSENNWASITEVQIWGPGVVTDPGGGSTGGSGAPPPPPTATYFFFDSSFSVDYQEVGLCNPVGG